jgi:hypothetical protein
MTYGRIVGLRIGLLWTLGCGGGGEGSSASPDADTALTIKLYNHLPFVEGDTANADFVAAQDGDGAWTTLTGDRGVYTMPRSSAGYGVLVVCHFEDVTVTKLFLKTATDGLLHTTTSCHVDPVLEKVPVTVTVTVKNVPTGSSAIVEGPSTASTVGGDADVVLQLAPRPSELFAWLIGSQVANPTKLVRIPPFTPQAGQAFTIDFATMGADPDYHPLTINGATAYAVIPGVATETGLYTFGSELGSTYPVLPAGLRRAGERTVVDVLTDNGNARAELVTPGPVTLDMLPGLAGAGFVTTSDDTPRPTWTVPALPPTRGEARLLMLASTASAPGIPGRRWQVFLTRARIGDANSVTYALPDLGALIPGLPTDIALPGRARISWSIQFDEFTTQADSSTIQVGTSAAGNGGRYCGDGAIEAPETCDPPDGSTCSDTCTPL